MKQESKVASGLVSLSVAFILPWQAVYANNLLDTVRGYLGGGSQYGAPSNQNYNNQNYNNQNYNNNRFNDPYSNGNNDRRSYDNDDRRSNRNDVSRGSFAQQQTTANLDQRIEQLRAETNAAQSSGRISNNQAGEIMNRLSRLRGALRSNNSGQLSFGGAQGIVNELNAVESQLQQCNANSFGRNQWNNRWASQANNNRDYR